ncbi:hypothetical protein Tco_1213582 [Tanacetum coccineum]
MIGSLRYLIASRPDLQFVVCMCAQYQAKPTEKHLHVVKRIFQYLKGTINMGMFYSKDSCIALTTFADADHAETQQVITYDEKWVPSTERVKISPTNVRLETIVHQKEETFQVIIDVIKNSTCFKVFTTLVEVPKIFMQQFWYTINKVKYTESYEFLLANKKCIVDVKVFRKILDICLRVEGEEFTEVQDNDATLTFIINLGYKGSLHKYTSMYVDHMHQPWRTLAAIINKCLFGKTGSNDRLRKSRIDILWGMFYRENVDYPELI